MSLGVSFGQFTENATEAHHRRSPTRSRRTTRRPRGARMEAHLDCGSRLMKDALLRGQLAGVGFCLSSSHPSSRRHPLAVYSRYYDGRVIETRLVSNT